MSSSETEKAYEIYKINRESTHSWSFTLPYGYTWELWHEYVKLSDEIEELKKQLNKA
jgi:hypothetical protein